MESGLHARAQILARLRLGRIGTFDRWDSGGGITRANYLTPTSQKRNFPSDTRARATG
jgi:hypothetical protein